MRLSSGNGHAYAYLDVGIGAGTNIILSIQKNRVEIGTITFIAGATLDAGGGQTGAFNIPGVHGIRRGRQICLRGYAIQQRHTSGLSVTLPFLRTDI